MPQCTLLGNAYRGWMMSEVVSVQALYANAPVFIVDVTRDDKEDGVLGDRAVEYTAYAAVLGKAQGAGSHEDKRVEQYSGCLLIGDFLQWKKETMKGHELFAIPMQGCREANWPGRRRTSTPRDVHRYIEYACMSWCKHVWICVRRARSLVDSKVTRRDVRPITRVLLGKPLTRDGGSRFKGVNSLKSSEDLWGLVRWQSRLDPFPYSEPLTNLAS
ncbi:hypothetical protein CRG98_029084 [Punica granatum]|uniref:Uncharacterized protein n=1 Tax=Punica granatum TaxID=22663 RepID=A0A2I0J3L7_PUNGR|nr:hypothetical protein CRG98_029084 [Punica granatum]